MGQAARIRALLDQGLTAYGLGRVDEARRAWTEVLSLEPGNPRALEYLRFLDENWTPNQEREEQPYRPDEGSDPAAKEALAAAAVARQAPPPASPPSAPRPTATPVIQPRPLSAVVPLVPPSAPEPPAGVPGPASPAFVPPARPEVDADAWGDLYDWAGQGAPPPAQAPAGAVPVVTPVIELKPLPVAPADPKTPAAARPKTSIPPPPHAAVSLPPLPELAEDPVQSPAQPDATPGTAWAVLTPPPVVSKAAPPPGLVVDSAFARPPTLDDIQPVPSAPTPPAKEPPEIPATPAPFSALGLVAGAAAEPEPEGPDDVGTLIRGARELAELDDFSGVLELVDKVLEQDGQHQEALYLKEQAGRQLEGMYASKVGELSRLPRVRMSQDEIIWLNLDHRAGFVLSLIDGKTCFEDIISVTGLSSLDALRILAQLIQEKVIEAD